MNLKRLFFVAVLLGTVIFIGVFGYAYFRRKNQTPQEYFKNGKAYYDKGKYSDATIELLNANRSNPDNRDIRYYLALSYLGQGDVVNAIRHLRALIEVHPDDVPANLKLGGIYLTAGRSNPAFFQQAQKLAEKVLSKDPQNVEAIVLSGNAAAGQNDIASAADTFEHAVALDPRNVQALISLGSVRLQQKRLLEAEKAFLKARESDPKSKSALLSLGNFYRISGSTEKAEAVLNDALAQYPSDREIYSQVSDFYLRSRRYDVVEKVLRSAQAGSGSDPAPTLDLADAYLFQNRGEDARKLLLDAKSKFPQSIPLAIKIAADLMQDKPDQAKLEIDRILKAEPKNAAGNALLGEFQYNSGQFDAAAETLGKEPAISSPFPQVHYLLGNIALKKGKPAESETHYRNSIKVRGDFVPARVALADQYISSGRFDDAKQQNQEALKLAPRNAHARLIKASLDANDRKYSEAEAEFSELAREFPGSPDVHRQMGMYYGSRGRNAEAEKSFLRALEVAPHSDQLFQELITFYILTKQTDRAMQKLNSVPDAQKQAFHYELVGMTDDQAGKLQDAEIAYKKALEKDPNRLSAEMHLIDGYVRSGRLDDAMKRLDDLTQKSTTPKNAVYAIKGSIQSARGDSKGAEESYRKALAVDPTTDLAANNLAYLLVQDGRNLEEALQMAQGVRKRQPQNPDPADTLGWIYYKLDRAILAKPQAEFAVSKQPENGEFQYHLGEIYRKNSEPAKAAAALRKAVNSPKDFKEKSLAATALKEIERQPTGAKP